MILTWDVGGRVDGYEDGVKMRWDGIERRG